MSDGQNQEAGLFQPAGRRRRTAELAQKVLRLGLLSFATCFLGHLLSDSVAPFQRQLAQDLDRAVEPGRRLVGALPREHAKTTLGTVALTLREACRDEPQNIMLIGANRDEAAAKLRLVVDELENNDRLASHFGDRLRPARDTKGHNVAYGDTEVILTGGTRISTLGYGGRIRGQLSGGRRLDLVVLDDPEDDQSVQSPRQRQKRREWFDRALLSSLDVKSGSLVWLGTLLHHDSVLAQLLRDKAELPNWQVFNLPAIDDNGEVLWPGRWSMEALMARKAEIGERAFAQEFLNRPASRDEQLFLPGSFGAYSTERLAVMRHGTFLGPDELQVYIGVDPAISMRPDSDQFAAVVIGIAGNSDVYILEVVKRRLRFADQLDKLTYLAKHWRPRIVGVEATAYQEALSYSLFQRGLPVRPLRPTASKALRIEAVAACCDRGQLYLPQNSLWVPAFREEAEDYPFGRFDDQLDALSMALKVGLENEQGGGEVLAAEQKRNADADELEGRRTCNRIKDFA